MSDLLLLSSSFTYGSEYLEYCRDDIARFLSGCRRMLFVPYAFPDHDEYTKRVQATLKGVVSVIGAHTLPVSAGVSDFDVVFCGGGNTFLLLDGLYRTGLLGRIRSAVQVNVRYIGSSAGANVACPSIGTTNDMPIVYPPSFDALNLVPFNINPHYYETPPGFPHMGETRRERIREFIQHNHRTVVAMEEGAILHRAGNSLCLRGVKGARVFPPLRGAPEVELNVGDDLSYLLRP